MRRLIADIVADVAALRAAYAGAGLLGGGLGGSGGDGPAARLLGAGEGADRFARDALLLEAVVRRRLPWLVDDTHRQSGIRHVAVFGGNNVGKSTVVNILAAAPIAEASPEGGHTRIARAFAAAAVPPFGESDGDDAGTGAVRRSALTSAAWPPEVVLWDTPDCDAVGSGRYLASVVEAVAGADLVVYVTTGEHYAVEHLAEWVFVLHDSGIALLECINKTRARDRALVIDGQARRIFPIMAERLGLPAPTPPIVPLRYLAEGEDSDLWGPSHPEAAELRAATLAAAGSVDRREAGRAALGFARRRVAAALEPVRLEVAARRDWDTATAQAADGFVAAYAQRYLTSSSVIEPFSRLSLALLELLDPEIPGLKQAMATIRWVTRWPARLILAAGRGVLDTLRGAAAAQQAALPPELRAYSAAHVELMAALARRIDRERAAPRHHPFWDGVATAWEDERGRLEEAFAAAVARHMQQTDAEIKQAAADIYAALQRRPATLGLLRGARVAANVGGALVGIILPGHGLLYDLLEEAIIAPAMMSATEAATSAAVEAHVARRKAAIVAKLRDEARRIAQALYGETLQALGERAMQGAGALGLDGAILDRLPENLRRLEEAGDG